MAETPQGDPGLQFEQAEFTQQAPDQLTCVACQQVIADQYFQAGEAVFCGKCRTAVEASLQGGSGMWRFIKASVFGSMAGLAGALLYCGVIWLTNYNLALITILVGVIVGRAVRAGSESRGGLAYQLLALFITYFSMAIAFAPLIYPGVRAEMVKDQAKQLEAAKASPAQPGAKVREPAPPVVISVLAAILAFLSALVLPFVQIATGDILYLIIFGVGLLEAWRATAKLVIEFKGPFAVRQPAPAQA